MERDASGVVNETLAGRSIGAFLSVAARVTAKTRSGAAHPRHWLSSSPLACCLQSRSNLSDECSLMLGDLKVVYCCFPVGTATPATHIVPS